MTPAQKIVGHLLGEAFNPEEEEAEEIFNKITRDPAYKLVRFPKEIRHLVANAPDEFIFALGDPNGNAELELGSSPAWPSYDGDNADYPWSKEWYTGLLFIDKGELWIGVISADSDGDNGYVNDHKYTPEKYAKLRLDYSRYAYYAEEAEYFEWVAETGKDPLSLVFVPPTPKTQSKWQVRARKVGLDAKFVNAQTGSKKFTDYRRLPAYVKEFLLGPLQHQHGDGIIAAQWEELIHINDDTTTVVMDGPEDVVITLALDNPDTTTDEVRANRLRRAAAEVLEKVRARMTGEARTQSDLFP